MMNNRWNIWKIEGKIIAEKKLKERSKREKWKWEREKRQKWKERKTEKRVKREDKTWKGGKETTQTTTTKSFEQFEKEMMNRWQWEQIDDVSKWFQLKKGGDWLSLTEELNQCSFEDKKFHQKKNDWWWNWENDWK